jgi:lipopolysaccharide export system permease protein
MQKRREITALEAGGVSFSRLVSTVLLLGLVWSGVQLGFSQVLGVYGQQMSDSIWDSLGHEQGEHENRLTDLWIRNQNSILHLSTVWPNEHKAQGIMLYSLDEEFANLERVIQAEALLAKDQGWQFRNAEILNPKSFSFSQEKELPLTLDLNLRSLQVSGEDSEPEDMSLWELSAHIDRLKDTGANVEALYTAWHLKLSYAFSVFILSAVALVLTRHWENLFLVISCGLGGIFVLLTVHTIGGTLGESGVLSPWLGAWLGNIMVGIVTASGLGVQIRGRL